MPRIGFDPGLTQTFTGRLRRSINPDGSFNVRRSGTRFRDTGFYLTFMNMSWPRFLLSIPAMYVCSNICFATAYYLIGVENLQGADLSTPLNAYLSAFFFSVQTFTTVGYGHIAPKGILMSSVAALEAMSGLLAFALATGLLYGRFSRPYAQLLYSDRMVVTTQQDRTAIMFRVANRRPNVLMEIEATLLLMTVEDVNGEKRRRYQGLTLEREKVYFLPLTWTIVHAIDQSSPLHGMTAADLERLQAEFLILIKAFDDTFSQVVHSRCSYTFDELAWGSKFLPAFETTGDGDLLLHVDKLSLRE